LVGESPQPAGHGDAAAHEALVEHASQELPDEAEPQASPEASGEDAPAPAPEEASAAGAAENQVGPTPSPRPRPRRDYALPVGRFAAAGPIGAQVVRWQQVVEAELALLQRGRRLDPNITPHLVLAIIAAESNGDPLAVSRADAIGLMQVLPSTFADLQGDADPFDPNLNIRAGITYLDMSLRGHAGDLEWALAGYNAGIAGSLQARAGTAELFDETIDYVTYVMHLLSRPVTIRSVAATPTATASPALTSSVTAQLGSEAGSTEGQGRPQEEANLPSRGDRGLDDASGAASDSSPSVPAPGPPPPAAPSAPSIPATSPAPSDRRLAAPERAASAGPQATPTAAAPASAPAPAPDAPTSVVLLSRATPSTVPTLMSPPAPLSPTPLLPTRSPAPMTTAGSSASPPTTVHTAAAASPPHPTPLAATALPPPASAASATAAPTATSTLSSAPSSNAAVAGGARTGGAASGANPAGGARGGTPPAASGGATIRGP
jgi:soluble lytic murein transglycosylase-like protein